MSNGKGDEGFDFSAWSALNEGLEPRLDQRPPLGSRYPAVLSDSASSPGAAAVDAPSPINHDDRGERWGGSIPLPKHLANLAKAAATSDGSEEQTRPPWSPSPV